MSKNRTNFENLDVYKLSEDLGDKILEKIQLGNK